MTPITGFLHKRTQSLYVVDTLSCSIGNGRSRSIDMLQLIEEMNEAHPKASFIFVSKAQHDDTVDYESLSAEWPNVLIIICNDKPYIRDKQMKNKQPEDIPPEMWLSSADDHMVITLYKATVISGCGAIVKSNDKYRDSANIMKYMPAYTYRTYYRGCIETNEIKSSEEMFNMLVPNIIDKTKCQYRDVRSCASCLKTMYRTCDTCNICQECRVKFLLKTRSICESYSLSGTHASAETPDRCNDPNKAE